VARVILPRAALPCWRRRAASVTIDQFLSVRRVPMRLASFCHDGRPGLALVVGDTLHGWCAGDEGYPGPLDDLLRRGADFAALADQLARAPAIDPATVTLLPPLSRPGKIVCIGLNYADHARETGREPPTYPAVFVRFPTTLVGHGGALVRPRASDQFDYEGELVAVIGTGGRHIPRAQALAHVAFYSIFNDASVRDYQTRSPQWTMGKNFDSTGAFGPVLVSADEVPPGGRGLSIRTRVDGETLQDSSTDQLIFDVATLVHLLSEVMTLEPGDLLVTGTPAGVGMARTPPRYLRPGEVCEVEIEGIGILRNPVVAEG